jgi:hypothetical protein
MSAVDLLQPILDGGLQRNNFFNGRLLSAEDLRAEQKATSLQVGLVAEAIGEGVADGLDVSVISTNPPRVHVTRGLALNRLGNLLYLADEAHVALVPAASMPDAASGLFVQCEPAPPASFSGDGAYILTIAPASGYSETAVVSDPNSTAAGRGACGARFTVSGVRFRLVPIPINAIDGIDETVRSQVLSLLPPPNLTARERLRNLVAHLCFGTRALGFADPAHRTAVKPVLSSWGVLDAMRTRGDLTPCDVPLAAVVLHPDGISFVDMWPARRRLMDAAAIDMWRGVAGPRRLSEAEAAFLQFQSQLEIVRSQGSSSTVAASTYFDVLPAGGWLPTGSGGFNWRTFLGPHAPPAVAPVDAALLRGILQRSWFDEPFALATNPPVPVRVYEVPEQIAGDAFVVFARSHNGNIRVLLSPNPGPNENIEVTATAATGTVTRATTRAGGPVIVPELAPGPHRVDVIAPDYLAVAPQNATVVGGRTVDLGTILSPLPNGSILVDPIDRRTGAHLSGRVEAITATGGGMTRSAVFEASSGHWLIRDLPAAVYTIAGSARGYQNASKPNVGPTSRGNQIETTLLFDPMVKDHQEPSRCVDVVGIRTLRIRELKLCIVPRATEFEEAYYYDVQRKYARETAVTSDKLRILDRARYSKSQPSNRYVAASGEIIYADVEPWERMIELELLTDEDRQAVQRWLRAWQEWFIEELEDPRIGERRPLLFIDPNFQPTRDPRDIPYAPPAYAVFGPFAAPVQIIPREAATKATLDIREEHVPAIGEDVMKRLYRNEIVQINDLAWSWAELIVDATGQPEELVKYLIADAAGAVQAINTDRKYLGIDKTTDKTLRDLGILDDVALANADEKRLAEKLGSRGFAKRLIEKARAIVTPEAWSLNGMGLSEGQIAGLKGRGIDSKGALTSNAARADGKAAISEVLGLDAAPAATRNAALDALTAEAVSVMTRSSIALAPAPSLTLWSGVDAPTATRLAGAGFETVDALAAADPNAVVAATGLSSDAATKLVDSAKTASRASLGIGALAGLSPTEEKSLKDRFGADLTVGRLAGKTAGEIARAFGGNVQRAEAVLRGIKSGLTVGGIG